MIYYDFSRLVANDLSAGKKSSNAEIAAWIMEPTGLPPLAVYITSREGQTWRLLPHETRKKTALSKKTTEEYTNIDTGILEKSPRIKKLSEHNELFKFQNGAIVPFAKRLKTIASLPKVLDKTCLFCGLFDKMKGPFEAHVWIVNFKGEYAKVYDIKLRQEQGCSSSPFLRFGQKMLRKVRPLTFKMAYYCTRKLAKAFFGKKTKFVTMPNPERLGHLVANTDVILSEHRLGLHGNVQKINFFIKENQLVQDVGTIKLGRRIGNKAFYSLLSQKSKILRPGSFCGEVLESVLHRYNYFLKIRPHHHRDIHNTLDNTPPIIELPQDCLKYGNSLLAKLGKKKPLKIALIHMRNKEFTQQQYKELADIEDVRYSYRNVMVENYTKALRYLSVQGYTLISLGTEHCQSQQKDLPLVNAREICSEDWFDLYVAFTCKFFLGDTSGAYALADLFRKPIIFTNFAPLGHVYSWSCRHITIFKKMFDKFEDKIVPASKLLASSLGYTIHMDKIDPDRYRYIDNTPEEILSVTEEMISRLEGTWVDKKADLILQRKFWSQIPIGYLHKEFNSKVGTKFLRNNQWLLR